MQISLLTLWFNSCVEKAESKIKEVKQALKFSLRQVNIEVRKVYFALMLYGNLNTSSDVWQHPNVSFVFQYEFKKFSPSLLASWITYNCIKHLHIEYIKKCVYT